LPTRKQPTAKKSAKKPAKKSAKKPAAKKSVKKPAAKRPAKKSAAKKSAKKPAAKKSAKTSAAKRPATTKPAAKKSAAKKPVATRHVVESEAIASNGSAPAPAKVADSGDPAASLAEIAAAFAASLAKLSADATDGHRASLHCSIGPPATDGAVLRAQQAAGFDFPTDYAALLLQNDGASLGFSLSVLGTADWLGNSQLLQRGRAFVADSTSYDNADIAGCVPIANLGQPNDWLLYHPARHAYEYCLNADTFRVDTLAAALARKARIILQTLNSD
jgi:hypothetical protein